MGVQEFVYDFSLVKLTGVDEGSFGEDLSLKERSDLQDRFENQFKVLKRKQLKRTDDGSSSSS